MPATAHKFRTEKKSIKAPTKTIRKRKEDKKIIAAPPTTILSLPSEMLREIIRKMPSQDRAPLGLVCKRLREADIEVPTAFDRLLMGWKDENEWITASNKDGTNEHQIRGSNDKPLRATPHFLRRAKTKTLEILYEKNVEDPKADFEVITSLCESIVFDKLCVRWCNTAGYADEFIPSLFANRDSASAQLSFTFHFAEAARKRPNIPASRKLLMNLPKLKNFQLNSMGWRSFASRILDDATLLHIVSNTDHAELGIGEFTAQGLLDIFEVVCKSDLPQKYVKLHSWPFTKGVEDLMRGFQIQYIEFKYGGMDTEYRHVDRNRQAVLSISRGMDSNTICFQMYKIDQNERATFDTIQW